MSTSHGGAPVILFDLIGAQVEPSLPWNGGSEYVKALFRHLVASRDGEGIHVLLSRHGILEPSFEAFVLEVLPEGRIHWIEEWPSLAALAKAEAIQVVFLGILQRFRGRMSFFGEASPGLRVVCVIPDLVEFEIEPTWRSILYERARTVRDWIWILRYGLFFPWISRRLRMRSRSGVAELVERLRAGFLPEFVALSEYTRFSIQRHLRIEPGAIHVHWPPASPNQQRLLKSAPVDDAVVQTGMFVLLGADRWSKNLDVVLDAGRILDEIGLPFRVVLVGNFTDRLIRYKFRSCPWLEIRSHLAPDEVVGLLAKAHALLFPTRCEGFGYPPIEAMLLGKRVLAAATTSVPEVAGDAGMYFPPDSPVMLAYLMHSLILGREHPATAHDPRGRAEAVLERQSRDLDGLIARLNGVSR